jgi:putative CocE/NonD family hydrolase
MRSLALSSLLLLSCRASAPAVEERSPLLVHDVYFQLREDTQANRRALREACHTLARLPGVVRLTTAEREEELARPGVSPDFDVSLEVVFADRAAHDAYQSSPEHQALLGEWAPRFARVNVFDAWTPELPEAERSGADAVRASYEKREVRIPTRDGKTLFTALYVPRDRSQKYPILLIRTPYSVAPYGPDALRERLGPSDLFQRAGYVFAYQDVRGCFQSEGEFVNMRPHDDDKEGSEIDESSDTWDTIDWLVKNVAESNGRVGLWGISYPGFYSAAGMIDAHPALKAVSPQAPIADWFWDDFRDHGALWLPHGFNFMANFGHPRVGLTTDWQDAFEHGTEDGYRFFLDLGPLSEADARWFHGGIPFWNEMLDHPNYDAFWQARDIRPHLANVAPAVLTVGGWFDAEDLFGPLKIYREVERKNPGVFNALVMGPWSHGGWARTDGDRLGNVEFGGKQSLWYRSEVEFPFFEHWLKDAPARELAEATVFETGANRWRSFERWPPAETAERVLYARASGALAWDAPIDDAGDEAGAEAGEGSDAFVSDPAHPVPYTEDVAIGMTKEYMTDDQRFAARRPDVLVYQTEPLAEDLTLAGPIQCDLWVSTTGTDADFVVKLIDVFPDDAPDWPGLESGEHMAGYHMLVRSEAIRGRFRNSYETPEPFVPDEPALVDLELLDVLHTFRAGHRLQIQIQSTWFPLMDRNPQTWVDNIRDARPTDFVAQTHRVHRSAEHATRFRVGVLPAAER